MVRYDELKVGDYIKLNEDWADLGSEGDEFMVYMDDPKDGFYVEGPCRHYLDGHIMFPEDNGEMPEFDFVRMS
jgi:hypothetical protein